MRKRPASSSTAAAKPTIDGPGDVGPRPPVVVVAKRSAWVILTLFVLVMNGSWAVYRYQFDTLPPPLTAAQVGKRGFSEAAALKHVKALSDLGPHTVGSDALDTALKYVLSEAEAIKKTAHWEVGVEVELFHTSHGSNGLASGLFKGGTHVYSDLDHVVMRILPKYGDQAGENAILVSSHVDTVFSAEGAGDCSSCVSVMLELARGVSQWAHGFKHGVIFLFNTGEEEGLNGAHSFITQHPWSDSVRVAIDLEAMGIGGKSAIFQAGPDPWAIENFAAAAKYPSAQIVAQDLFSSGAIKSATDFQVYKEVAGLSGLDFAFVDNSAVYHTKNDKLKLLKPGSLQHLGDNMLAFLLRAGAASDLPVGKGVEQDGPYNGDTAIYFDVLGTYMITFRQRFANIFYNSTILESLLIWVGSVKMGGSSGAIALALSCLSIVLMWICSVSFAALVAVGLPFVSSSPIPYISSPWLAGGLFGGPALLGAFTGQHLGYIILTKYLSAVYSKRFQNLSSSTQVNIAKLDSERWLYKAGSMQWFLLLILGNYFKIGSTYLALVWLVSPLFAYGLLEATLSPIRLPRPLKTSTLLLGLLVPFLLSSGMMVRLTSTVIGTAVRFERTPGSNPEWLASVIIAILVAAFVCLTLVYLLSYVHISGAKVPLVVTTLVLFLLSVGAVSFGLVQAFTEDASRAVNVVHVVDATGKYGGKEEINSYISLFSPTPGNLMKEAEIIGKGMVCGTEKQTDFVTFSVKYSCWIKNDTGIGWDESDIPTLHIKHDTSDENRITEVSLDTKSSHRWSLAINTEEIEDFLLKDSEGTDLISVGSKSSVNGWHVIKFSGGKKSPTKFHLTLFWINKNQTSKNAGTTNLPLLKLRTDVDRLTPQAREVIKSLPPWCSQFGKSTSPHNLAFITSLPVQF